MLRTAVLLTIAGFTPTMSIAQTVEFKSGAQVVCGSGIYKCLSAEDLQALGGRKLRYQHSRGGQFGQVMMSLGKDGHVTAENGTGSSGGGTWQAKNSAIDFKFRTWGDQTIHYVRIEDHLFLHIPATSVLIPIAVE